MKNHKDLGIHSEMFSDGVVDLVESGAITNAKKLMVPGRSVGSFVIGTKKVFEFIDNNPSVGKCFSSSDPQELFLVASKLLGILG